MKLAKSLNLLVVLIMLAGQSLGGDQQRARQAEKLFMNKQYVKALPLYAQLVSNHPENYKYNYYYGVCLLITDRDKPKAVSHLERALIKPKSPEEVYYYLGKAYHLNYMFEEGIRSFQEFTDIYGIVVAKKWNVDEVSEYCFNAKNNIDTARYSQINEYIPASTSDFFTKYAFEGNYGKILSMPDDYKSKRDKEDNPTIFLSANGKVMYYSAYASESSSRDIYKVEKSNEGTWGEPERMDATVNTSKDEMYPTCSADGRVLYFSSRGHNSYGGFDIFKCVYSLVEEKWMEAENMGAPYNSPFDDFNFVPSAEDGFAYFSSTRDCNWGQINVCKLAYKRGEQIPIELKGKFVCINDTTMRSAMITVTKFENDSLIAVLNTDPESGLYNLMLPGAGKYKFTIEGLGYNPHTQVTQFSEFDDTYFVQEIYLSRNQSGAEDMAINNIRERDIGKIANDNLMAAEDENGMNAISAADVANANGSSLSPGAIITDASPSGETMTKATTGNISGINFRVQVGAFSKQTIEQSQTKLERKTSNSMMTHNSDKKWNRFYIGKENTYEQAAELKKILMMAGFKDAFIVAFKEDEVIPIKEARQ